MVSADLDLMLESGRADEMDCAFPPLVVASSLSSKHKAISRRRHRVRRPAPPAVETLLLRPPVSHDYPREATK